MATRRLTVYLLRNGVQDFHDALAASKPSAAIDVARSAGVDGRFYRVKSVPKTPSWVSFVQPILADNLGDMRSSTTSGLLLIRTSARMFAITFGYGRSLLDLSKVEPQFGLRVALNRIDPSQIRSLDTKTFEDMVLTTNRQTSRNAELPAFGVDVSTDILRAATGTPRDTGLAKRLSGSDALVMNLEMQATDLPALCDRLLDAFGADDYKSDFAWIDQLALVRDEELLSTLNDGLVAELAGGVVAATHLAMPEPISWEDIDAFKIGGTSKHEYDDLDIEDYLTGLGSKRGDITLERLKSRKVSIRYSRAEGFDARWSLYQCLVSEQRVGGTLYVLIEGRWFAISDSLLAEVDAFLAGLAAPGITFPESSPGEAEGDYNDRVAKGSPRTMLKLDAKIKRPGGATSGIELCDVLTDQGEFVHVKRKARSATLSHLFAQGNVSARTFMDDGHFRDEIRSLIEADVPSDNRDVWLDLIPGGSDQIDRARYSVTFAVIANSARSGMDWLPFFSKLNLMQHGRQLRRLGFEVAVARVPISRPTRAY